MFTLILAVIILIGIFLALPEKTVLAFHRSVRRTAKKAANKIEDVT